MAGNQRVPYISGMKLASDFGCKSTDGTSVLGAGGSLLHKSAIDAAVEADEMMLIDTSGASAMVMKPLMRDVPTSGSGTNRPTLHFYGIIASDIHGNVKNNPNPYLAIALESWGNTISSGVPTGISTNDPVVSASGYEFYSHDDWDHGIAVNSDIVVLNTRLANQAVLDNCPDLQESSSSNAISDVGSDADDSYFAFSNSAALFDTMAVTFSRGSMSSGIGNLYYSLLYH